MSERGQRGGAAGKAIASGAGARDFAHPAAWRAWREHELMSQQAMADALGLSKRTVQGIELGEHRASWTSQMRFRALVERYERNRRGESL